MPPRDGRAHSNRSKLHTFVDTPSQTGPRIRSDPLCTARVTPRPSTTKSTAKVPSITRKFALYGHTTRKCACALVYLDVQSCARHAASPRHRTSPVRLCTPFALHCTSSPKNPWAHPRDTSAEGTNTASLMKRRSPCNWRRGSSSTRAESLCKSRPRPSCIHLAAFWRRAWRNRP